MIAASILELARDHCQRHRLIARADNKRRRNRGANEDDEYEVEEIFEARVYRKKLQYRVKWLGCDKDPEWYDASNFRNCPHKLRDFT